MKNGSKYSNDIEPSPVFLDDVDLMLYVGHGLGNNLHFSHVSNGYLHSTNPSSNGHKVNELNFNLSDAKFGYGSARTKWVVAYTCNYLKGDINTLRTMLQGANIVLGYSTTSYLIRDQMENFGENLKNRTPLIDAWFSTSSIHTEYAPENATMAALYVDDARFDSIYHYLGDTRSFLEENVKYIEHCMPGRDD